MISFLVAMVVHGYVTTAFEYSQQVRHLASELVEAFFYHSQRPRTQNSH